MVTVRASHPGDCFCGHDVEMRSPYDAELVATVKAVLAKKRAKLFTNVGGWNPDERYWWCTEDIWPAMAHRITAAGHHVLVNCECLRGEDDDEPDEAPPEPKQQRQQPPPPKPPPPPPKPQPWEILGLPPTASREDVETRWRELARQWHPDRLPMDMASELREMATKRIAAINAARDAMNGAKARRP